MHLKIASATKPEQLTTGMKTEWKHSTKEFKFSATAPVRNLNTTISPMPNAANSAKATNKKKPNSPPIEDIVIGKNDGNYSDKKS